MIWIIRVLFLFICAGLGYRLIDDRLGLLAFSLGAVAILLLEFASKRVRLKTFLIVASGLIVGLICANLLAYCITLVPFSYPISRFIFIALNLSLGYLGITIAWKKRDEIAFAPLTSKRKITPREGARTKVLDTSVIIDGRIADICQTKFVEGTLLIPRFVLRELQSIADSSDSLKRNRGRRGLDILNRLQKQKDLDVKISEQDFPAIREVDGKLIQLTKVLDGLLVTNDFNLNKVAELQAVEVLNVNELANALRPVVLPGEVMNVRIIKGGKDPGQGVAYLDDGTMVVVDEGEDFMGKTMDVVVTSVLQTTAGRMIFTRLKEAT
ncbi:TRAM domain-containing protein [bacterium]|nr:TRAM domain-containing protein [bacterium]